MSPHRTSEDNRSRIHLGRHRVGTDEFAEEQRHWLERIATGRTHEAKREEHATRYAWQSDGEGSRIGQGEPPEVVARRLARDAVVPLALATPCPDCGAVAGASCARVVVAACGSRIHAAIRARAAVLT